MGRLANELGRRRDVPHANVAKHLAGDIQRVCLLWARQWLLASP